MLHAGGVPHVDLATWTFRVFGEVEQEVDARLGAVQRAAALDATCRTSTASRAGAASTPRSRASTGASSRSSAARARRARFVDRPRRARLHLERAARLARGRPRAARDPRRRRAARRPSTAGPLRLVVPGKYFWKSAKWLRGIELLGGRPARLLGALRLPQRRRPLARGALLVLDSESLRRVTRADAGQPRLGPPMQTRSRSQPLTLPRHTAKGPASAGPSRRPTEQQDGLGNRSRALHHPGHVRHARRRRRRPPSPGPRRRSPRW